jgi:hypothetical protein
MLTNADVCYTGNSSFFETIELPALSLPRDLSLAPPLIITVQQLDAGGANATGERHFTFEALCY